MIYKERGEGERETDTPPFPYLDSLATKMKELFCSLTRLSVDGTQLVRQITQPLAGFFKRNEYEVGNTTSSRTIIEFKQR